MSAIIRGFLKTIEKSAIHAGPFRTDGLAAVLLALAVLFYGVPLMSQLLGR